MQTKSYPRGPAGEPITLADLPSPDTRRWVKRHKAMVVACVRGGLITLDGACERYRMTMDEYLSWERQYDNWSRALRKRA